MSVTVLAASLRTRPAPEMVLPSVKASERLRISVPLLRIAPPTAPPAPPEPSCSAPAWIVVGPEKLLEPVSTSVPSPSFVRLPPELVSAVASVTVWELVSMA